MPATTPTRVRSKPQLAKLSAGLADRDVARAIANLEEWIAAYVPELFTAKIAGTVPASGGAATDFLCADGTWKSVSGTGLVDSVSAGSSMVTVSPTTGAVVVDVVPANFTGIPQSAVTDLVADLAALVPLTRTVQGTTPILIDGGTVAVDLTMDRVWSLADNGVTDVKLRDSAALSVIGRASGTLGDPADITSSADGSVLQRQGGALSWDTSLTLAGTLTLSPLTEGSVLFAGAGGVVSEDNDGIYWDDTSDRLGLRTTSPGAVVDVQQTAAVAGTEPSIRIYNTGGGADGRAAIEFWSDLTTARRWFVGIDTTGGTDKAFQIRDFTAGGALNGVRLNIDTTGRVGINTISPDTATKMHVVESASGAAAANTGSVLAIERTGGAYLTIKSSTAADKGVLFCNPTSAVDGSIIYDNTNNTRGLQFRTGGNSTKQSIFSNGNVNIGTTLTDPGVKLRVEGSLTATGNVIIGDAAGDSHTVNGAFDINHTLNVDGNATLNANVTLGNASGDAHSLLGTLNLNATAGSNGQIAQVSGGVPVWGAPSAASIPTGTGTAGLLVRWTGTSTQGDSVVRDNGAQVGIGTAASANAAMTFAGVLGDKIHLYPVGAANAFGFGIQTNTLQYFVSDTGHTHSFGYGDSDAYTAVHTLAANGNATFNIGGGTTTVAALTVLGNCTLGDTSGDAHTVNGLLTCNDGVTIPTGQGLSTDYIFCGSLDDIMVQNRGTGAGTFYLDADTIEIGATTQGAAAGAAGNGKVVIAGAVCTPTEISPAQITANQNDYNPTGWATASFVLLTSDAARSITGFDSTSYSNDSGRHVWIYNNGSFDITLEHEDGGSTAGNRIAGIGNADVILNPGDCAHLYLSNTKARWVVVSAA